MTRKRTIIIIEEESFAPIVPRGLSVLPISGEFLNPLVSPPMFPSMLTDLQKEAERVRNCPCNPLNGGSGMCSCVSPFSTITC